MNAQPHDTSSAADARPSDVVMLDRTIDAPRLARRHVRDLAMALGDERAEDAVLLVSELVTNAVKYSRGEVTLRLVNERALVCEVIDSSGALPRLRSPNGDDENGRGLQVVRQLSQRWGARRTANGKVVWCEQPLPGRAGLEEPQPFH